MKTSLSIVLVVHDRQQTLAATATRLIEHGAELASRVELLLADHGSSDRTIEAADELAVRYPQVRAVRFAARMPHAEVVRAAIDLARGDAVLAHDGTTDVRADQIDRLWAMRNRPDILLAAPHGASGLPRWANLLAGVDGSFARARSENSNGLPSEGHGFCLVRRHAIKAIRAGVRPLVEPPLIRLEEHIVTADDASAASRTPYFLVRLRQLAMQRRESRSRESFWA